MSDYTIRRTCDASPVQYEGEVDGRHWYFRARYDEWRFGVGDDVDAAVEVSMGIRRGYVRTGAHDPNGDGWGASWMDHELAESLILLCITDYRAEHRA